MQHSSFSEYRQDLLLTKQYLAYHAITTLITPISTTSTIDTKLVDDYWISVIVMKEIARSIIPFANVRYVRHLSGPVCKRFHRRLSQAKS